MLRLIAASRRRATPVRLLRAWERLPCGCRAGCPRRFSTSSSADGARLGFADLVRPELCEALRALEISSPNAVQAEAMPLVMSKRDVVCCAQTGSGKTLLFLLPFIQRLSEQERVARRPRKPKKKRRAAAAHGGHLPSPQELQGYGHGHEVYPSDLAHMEPDFRGDDMDETGDSGGFIGQPEAIVLVPSRELALQVGFIAQELVKALPEPFGVTLLTNGARVAPEKQQLRSGHARLCVATPARLLLHVDQGQLCLKNVRYVAIDEADAVLCAADGVHREGEEVLAALPKNRRRQFVLTAATIGAPHAEKIAELFPRAQRVSHEGVLVPTLRQNFRYVRGDKDAELLRLLETSFADRWLGQGATIVFVGGPRTARHVHAVLSAAMPEMAPAMLHGETTPEERQLTLRKFYTDETLLLVTSDVAARGLDFPSVRHVIMYDLPRDVAGYVHRAGRTARRGRGGLVTCLVSPAQDKLYRALRLGEAEPGSPLQLSSGRAGRPRPSPRPRTPPRRTTASNRKARAGATAG